MDLLPLFLAYRLIFDGFEQVIFPVGGARNLLYRVHICGYGAKDIVHGILGIGLISQHRIRNDEHLPPVLNIQLLKQAFLLIIAQHTQI